MSLNRGIAFAPLTNQATPKAHRANDSSQNTGLMSESDVSLRNQLFTPINTMHPAMIIPQVTYIRFRILFMGVGVAPGLVLVNRNEK